MDRRRSCYVSSIIQINSICIQGPHRPWYFNTVCNNHHNWYKIILRMLDARKSMDWSCCKRRLYRFIVFHPTEQLYPNLIHPINNINNFVTIQVIHTMHNLSVERACELNDFLREIKFLAVNGSMWKLSICMARNNWCRSFTFIYIFGIFCIIDAISAI